MTRVLKISPRSELDTRSQKHIAIGCLLSININTWFEVLEEKCNNQSSAKIWSHTCKWGQVLVRTWSNKCEGNASRLQYWCVNHTLAFVWLDHHSFPSKIYTIGRVYNLYIILHDSLIMTSHVISYLKKHEINYVLSMFNVNSCM